MVFNSLQFAWFFVLVYGLYRLLPAVSSVEGAHRGQNWLLLIASYYFYAAWDYRFLALLSASTIVDYSCGRLMGTMHDERRRRLVMWLSIAFNLTLLGFFKYFNFFVDNLQALFAAIGWHVDYVTLRVLLPIGISFYTFVTMSYVIDVYRRDIEPTRNFVDFAVFVAYFPHLVAGPILRATALLPQIAHPRQISAAQMREGAWLIAWGFFQKIFVADNLAPLASHVFAPDAHATGINVLLGSYAFAFQIYGDFAGYSNIARGTSKLMGIELMENFRFPYLVRTPQEFWRHWHISLSTWLRDYLYIPLGGSRHGAWRTRANLLITMLLGGLWHGAAWTFVLWGLYNGALLVAERLTGVARLADDRLQAVRRAVTFVLVVLGWVLFRAAGIGDAGEVYAAMFSFDAGALPVRLDEAMTPQPVAALLIGLASVILPRRLVLGRVLEGEWSGASLTARVAVVAAAPLAAITVAAGSFSPFLYFQF